MLVFSEQRPWLSSSTSLSSMVSIPAFFDQALAYKVTTTRLRDRKRIPAGEYMEDDVHGSQMYFPLMKQKLPEGLRSEVQQILDRPISTF